ncbi:peptidase M16 inactive domain-containing protein, partial [Cardiosporidium cionae]
VGDFSVEEAEKEIKRQFSSFSKPLLSVKRSIYAELYNNTEKLRSVHFPALKHRWPAIENIREFQSSEVPVLTRIPSIFSPSSSPSLLRSFFENRYKEIKTTLRSPHPLNFNLWQHDLIKGVFLGIMRKLPIQPVKTFSDYKYLTLKKIILHALAARLTIFARGKGIFRFIEMNEGDSIREGCRVTALDIQTDPLKWKEAIRLAIHEVRSMARFGLTLSEFEGILSSYLTDLDRMQLNRLSSADLVKILMDCTACGHTLMDIEQESCIARHILTETKVEEVNIIAKTFCGWLEKSSQETSIVEDSPLQNSISISSSTDDILAGANTIIACFPTYYRSVATSSSSAVPPSSLLTEAASPSLQAEEEGEGEGVHTAPSSSESEAVMQRFHLTETHLRDVLKESIEQPLVPPTHTVTPPPRLMSIEEVENLEEKAAHMAAFVPIHLPKEGDSLQSEDFFEEKTLYRDSSSGIRMRQLQNGLKINMKKMETEKGSLLIRGRIEEGHGMVEGGISSKKEFSAQPAHLRGRKSPLTREKVSPQSPLLGSRLIGARTLMEGGALGNFTREEIELFCSQNLLGVLIECSEEFFSIEFSVPSPPPQRGRERQVDELRTSIASTSSKLSPPRLNGIENAFIILHHLLTAFHIEKDAFERGKAQIISEYEHHTRDLQSYSMGELLRRMTKGDKRWGCLTPEDCGRLTIKDIQIAIQTLFKIENCELSLAGDMNVTEVDTLVKRYLGTISPSSSSTTVSSSSSSSSPSSSPLSPSSSSLSPSSSSSSPSSSSLSPSSPSLSPSLSSPSRASKKSERNPLVSSSINYPKLKIPSLFESLESSPPQNRSVFTYVVDSDERAIVYIAGFAPNKWGILSNSTHIVNLLNSNTKGFSSDSEYLHHHGFGRVALVMLQEILNKRMFSVLRGDKQLTYDATFEFIHFDSFSGGLFLITVHTNPDMIESVITETKKALLDC